MAPPIKYSGPCELHIAPHRHCGHCQQWAKRQRNEAKGPHGVPIYRELHWPAPENLHG